MANTFSFSPGPIGGGTINAALAETLWLGGKRFFMIYAQTAPNYLVAVTIDLANDPYSATNTQTANTALAVGSKNPIDRPMLMRLDSNRVLMFWSSSTSTDAHFNDQTLVFDAMVFGIAADGTVTMLASYAACAPSAFMNFTGGALSAMPTVSRALSLSLNAFPSIAGPSFCAPLSVSGDGAAVNRILICARNNADNGLASATKNFSLWDVQYTVASSSLTITKVFSSPAMGWSQYNSAGYRSWDGPNDYPWLYSLPGTTKVVAGWINYDPMNTTGVVSNTIDKLSGSATSTSGFATGNTAYVFDYTQAGSSWTAAVTIPIRRGAVLCPLDSNRLLEVCGQTCTAANGFVGNYARVFNIINNQFSGDLKIDGTTATSNQNAMAAIGTISQVTPLGNDKVLIVTTPRAQTPTAAYFGIYSLASGYPSTIKATAFGQPILAPLTFQRGLDAIIPRGVNDPANASAYDFFGRTSALTHVFVRYANPM